jgi:hypothetical protein
MDQKEDGSITVFLSIIFLLFFAMFGVSFENVRSLISAGHVRTSAYSAAVTAFGDYNKELYREYGLFGYGGAEGKNVSDLEFAYQRVLFENLSAVPVKKDKQYVDLFGYRDIDAIVKKADYITDSNEFLGQVTAFLKQEAVMDIKDTIDQKIQTADKNEIQSKLAVTKDYEQGKYEQSDDKKATKGKNAAEEKQEISHDKTDSAGGNPLKFFTNLARDGILGLVCDEDRMTDGVITSCQENDRPDQKDEDDKKNKEGTKKVTDIKDMQRKDAKSESEAGAILSDFISKSQKQEDEREKVNSPIEKISIIRYANKVFSSYTNEQNRTTKYGLEYLIGGKSREKDNLISVINRLLVVRLLLNFTCVMSDAAFQEKSLATATAIAGITGLPPVINAIQYTILLILSFEEACVDVRALLMGKKISALKKSSDFQMKYEEICMGSKKLFTQKANVYPNDDGKKEISSISYSQYLWSFLLFVSQDTIEKRIFSLIEYDLREKYNRTFCVHTCICKCRYKINYQIPYQFCELPFLENSLFQTKYTYKSLEVNYGYKSE